MVYLLLLLLLLLQAQISLQLEIQEKLQQKVGRSRELKAKAKALAAQRDSTVRRLEIERASLATKLQDALQCLADTKAQHDELEAMADRERAETQKRMHAAAAQREEAFAAYQSLITRQERAEQQMLAAEREREGRQKEMERIASQYTDAVETHAQACASARMDGIPPSSTFPAPLQVLTSSLPWRRCWPRCRQPASRCSRYASLWLVGWTRWQGPEPACAAESRCPDRGTKSLKAPEPRPGGGDRICPAEHGDGGAEPGRSPYHSRAAVQRERRLGMPGTMRCGFGKVSLRWAHWEHALWAGGFWVVVEKLGGLMQTAKELALQEQQLRQKQEDVRCRALCTMAWAAGMRCHGCAARDGGRGS